MFACMYTCTENGIGYPGTGFTGPSLGALHE